MMKNILYRTLTIVLTITILLSTSKNIQAQTIEITSEQLRLANKIFVEHKYQKDIIEEQNLQITFLEKSINSYENKVEILNQVIENKDSIHSLVIKKHQYQTENFKHENKLLKNQKRRMTFIAITASVLAIGAIFIN